MIETKRYLNGGPIVTTRLGSRRSVTAEFLVLVTAIFVGSPTAFGGGAPALRAYTIDAGGTVLRAGDIAVSGTVGQPDVAILAGGAFTVHGGFWPSGGDAAAPGSDAVFRDGFE